MNLGGTLLIHAPCWEMQSPLVAAGFPHFFKERVRVCIYIAERQKIIERIALFFFASNLVVRDLLEGNLGDEESKEISPGATPTCRYQVPPCT